MKVFVHTLNDLKLRLQYCTVLFMYSNQFSSTRGSPARPLCACEAPSMRFTIFGQDLFVEPPKNYDPFRWWSRYPNSLDCFSPRIMVLRLNNPSYSAEYWWQRQLLSWAPCAWYHLRHSRISKSAVFPIDFDWIPKSQNKYSLFKVLIYNFRVFCRIQLFPVNPTSIWVILSKDAASHVARRVHCRSFRSHLPAFGVHSLVANMALRVNSSHQFL